MVIALGGFAAALLVLLLLLAADYLGKALAHLVQNIPLVGGHLAGALRGATAAISDWAGSAWDSTVAALASVITVPIAATEDVIADVQAAIAEAVTTDEWIVGSVIPRAGTAVASQALAVANHTAARLTADLGAIADRAAADLTTAEAYAATEAGQVAARLSADLGAIADRAAADLTTAKAYAATEAGQVAARLSADLGAIADRAAANLTTAEAYADARAGQVTALLGSEVTELSARIVDTAEATAAGVYGTLSTDIGRAATAAGAAATDAARAAESAAAGGFGDVLAGLGSISWAGVADVAGVTAATAAIAATMGRYLADCGIPNCRNLSGVGRALADLFAAVEDGALLAVLAGLIADPAGGAAEIESVLGPITDPLVTGARNLLGVG